MFPGGGDAIKLLLSGGINRDFIDL
ncbi:MAG: hypothetical protein RLZZ50_1394, partial [Verrucomicrobiota bacterium]